MSLDHRYFAVAKAVNLSLPVLPTFALGVLTVVAASPIFHAYGFFLGASILMLGGIAALEVSVLLDEWLEPPGRFGLWLSAVLCGGTAYLQEGGLRRYEILLRIGDQQEVIHFPSLLELMASTRGEIPRAEWQIEVVIEPEVS